MKILCIGGGPGALYFALLAKKRRPDWHVEIRERNPKDVTWGFGVVFSDATMENFQAADHETWKAITDSFFHWQKIRTFVRGRVFESGGHGFAGMRRLRLLQILERRALELGVEVVHGVEVDPAGPFDGYDLVVAADGANSAVRREFAADFGTGVEWRPNRFVWLGTDVHYDAFTFLFDESEHGLWRGHCYQYIDGADERGCRSTFIAECTEETWRRAGIEEDDEDGTIALCHEVFGEHLRGARLFSNRSIWRSFPVVHNRRFFRGNVVLLGDALHTAHFSIGSGTKLAMEDAIALADALVDGEARGRELGERLQAYQGEREPVIRSTQRSAQVSMEWFEETERYFEKQEPEQFHYSMLTRSLRINHGNLELRDPELIRDVERWFVDRALAGLGDDAVAAAEVGRVRALEQKVGRPCPPLFAPLRLRDLVLHNRAVVSPMCMYSADEGTVGDFHLVHLGSRAMGGAGLVYTEMTAVSEDARITPGCAGIYSGEHVAAWRRIVDWIHRETGARTCLQLGHAGRKGSTKRIWEGEDVPLESGNWPILGPDPRPYKEFSAAPKPMTEDDMERVTADFVAATGRALEAGFDMVEVHLAHGYLLSSFLSPLTNARDDEFGPVGAATPEESMERRMRFPLQVVRAVRAAWPADRPLAARISATDWAEGGIRAEDTERLVTALKDCGVDLVDVSAGQVVPHQRPVYGRLFQTPFSTRLRLECGVRTMTVGNIQSFGDANAILVGGRADLCALARMHLADPYWTRHAAYDMGWPPGMPPQYTAVERYTPRWA